MILNRLLIVFCFLTFCSISKGEVVYTKADSLIFEAYIVQFSPQKEQPTASVFFNTAKFFLGKPYISSTLEGGEEERLVVNLREFDCVTFVESCLALSLTLKSETPSFALFCTQLKSIRYRNGDIEGYPSRLHYMSDWIYENGENGLIDDITKDCGGRLILKDINFMTTNSHLYHNLKDNKINVGKLKKIEEDISSRNNYIVLPSFSIEKESPKIKNGDIVLFATKVNGLDYSHLGIAYWQKGKLHFIHASSKEKKAIIERKTLEGYCKSLKTCSGISILKVN